MAIGCVICTGAFSTEDNQEKQPIAIKRCGHTFHSDCLNSWLANSKSCPLCRLEVPSTSSQHLQVIHLLSVNELDEFSFDKILDEVNKQKEQEVNILRQENEQVRELAKYQEAELRKDIENMQKNEKKLTNHVKGKDTKIAKLDKEIQKLRDELKAQKSKKGFTSVADSLLAGSRDQTAKRSSARIAALRLSSTNSENSATADPQVPRKRAASVCMTASKKPRRCM